MISRKLPLILLLAWTGAVGAAYGDWTASGTFRYIDREFDQSGFTGVEPSLPIRLATVEVRDLNLTNKKAILATGVTDADGHFNILVPDSRIRTVYVRVISDSTAVPGLYLRVETVWTPKVPYAVASAAVAGHDPAANVDFGIVTAAIGAGGEAFNIYDTGLNSVEFIAALNGARPGSNELLTLEWEAASGLVVSSYNSYYLRVHVGDPSAYNDTVIAHETGHYAYQLNSASDNPGGTHHLTDCNQDLRLAYDEGRATWFGQSARRHFNLSRPDLYVKTTGAPGPGNLDFYFNLESETPYYCDGAASEVAVYAALWDINDSAATGDGTPGEDDESLDRPAADNWDVDKNFIPTAANKSLEDFWDGWFAREKGFKTDMTMAFQATNVEFYPDAGEPNDSVATALFHAGLGDTFHQTYFADPDGDGVGQADTDYFSFTAVALNSYTIETLNLWGRANTSLELLDSDGETVLASNDNRSPTDFSSMIGYTATADGTLYVRSFHAPDYGVYGSYDFRISGNAVVDGDLDTYTSDVDCNDADPSIHPGAVEVCNGVDDNCVDGIDEGFDVDGDTYTTCGGDCDDGAAAVNPGAAETCDNGIDDNCDDLIDAADPSCQVETVVITYASWTLQNRKLSVRATSSAAPQAVLTLVGYGTMVYDAENDRYTLTVNNTPNPGTVTVTSSEGGSDTKPVTVL